MTTRILLVDDHEILREIFRDFLSLPPEMEVTGEAASGEQALERLTGGDYDIVVLDWALPGMSGLVTLRAIHTRAPHLPVIMTSMHPEIPYATQAFRAGASGYVCKHNARTQLAEAVRSVRRSGVYLSPALAVVLEAQFVMEPEQHGRALLSEREVLVQSFIAAGKSDDDIAHELGLLPWEVASLRARIQRKLHAAGRRIPHFGKPLRARPGPAGTGVHADAMARIARERRGVSGGIHRKGR